MQDTLEYVIGSRVQCAGEECGEVEFVVVDPVADKLTHLVVRPDDAGAQARLVPVHIAVPGPDGVELNCTRARFDEFEPAMQTFFVPEAERIGPAHDERVLEWPFYGLVLAPSNLMGMAAPGVSPQHTATTVERIPVGEVSIRRGERVHAVDGEIGRVRGLIVAPPDSEVSHVLLDQGHLWGRKRVAIPIRDVSGIDVDGVAVRLAKAEIKDLPPVDVDGLEAEPAD
jgi:sporulation protein YlmC with PRC-barrel domain